MFGRTDPEDVEAYNRASTTHDQRNAEVRGARMLTRRSVSIAFGRPTSGDS
jgi:hypothetical protein